MNNNVNYDDIVRGDTIIEMHKGILRTVLESMKTHGENENSQIALSMITASFIMSINEIDRAFNSNVLSTMIEEMLKMKHNNGLSD